MSEKNAGQNQTDAAEYAGPYRRSLDAVAEEEAGLIHHGSVRMRTIQIVMAALSGGIALVLIGTVRKTRALIETLSADGETLSRLESLLSTQEVLSACLLVMTLLSAAAVAGLILLPLRRYITQIREHRMLPMHGSYELRYLARAYNGMFEENRKRNEELRYKVEHDHLTGLYNRGAFEKLRELHEDEQIALLLIDVDKFKTVNDVYGHDVGDLILQKVARQLSHGFRASDYPCRIGGDEFAVIMTGMDPSLRSIVLEKVQQVSGALADTSDELPAVTLSIGVAFSAQRKEGGIDLFKMADKALYVTKKKGRNGCAFYEEETA